VIRRKQHVPFGLQISKLRALAKFPDLCGRRLCGTREGQPTHLFQRSKARQDPIPCCQSVRPLRSKGPGTVRKGRSSRPSQSLSVIYTTDGSNSICRTLANLESSHADLTAQCARKDQALSEKDAELASQKEELDGWILKARRRLEAIKYLRTGEAPPSTAVAARSAENGAPNRETGPSRSRQQSGKVGGGDIGAPASEGLRGGPVHRAEGLPGRSEGLAEELAGQVDASHGRERSVKERLGSASSNVQRAHRLPESGNGQLDAGTVINGERKGAERKENGFEARAERGSPQGKDHRRIHITDSRPVRDRLDPGGKRETEHPGTAVKSHLEGLRRLPMLAGSADLSRVGFQSR
jgi:hypothetical protein